MANTEHLDILQQGVQVWNTWRLAHPDVRPDFDRSNLEGARLQGVYLGGANLRGANLRKAYLGGADLTGANLVAADLRSADLRGADLGGANLRGADLGGANFDTAQLYETVLANVDLSTVNGLDTCKHLGPSSLDHRTLARSGPLPYPFLQGCGLSAWQIEAVKLNWPDLSNAQLKVVLARIDELRSQMC